MDDVAIAQWREDWVTGKVRMALSFGAGAVDVPGYGEATFLLCAVLSAIASEVWPGNAKDRARFVELLVRYTPPELRATTISVPLLEAWLRGGKRTVEAQDIRNTMIRYPDSRVLQGKEVDVTEDVILEAHPTLRVAEVRSFSYAALLYSELRSGYAHEYQPGNCAVSWSMSSNPHSMVCYANQIDPATRESGRLIHFPVPWMAELTTHAEQLTRGVAPAPSFQDWWFSGRNNSR
jgi:hypothetical protein